MCLEGYLRKGMPHTLERHIVYTFPIIKGSWEAIFRVTDK